MTPISYKRHRFPPDIIRHAIWLYARFTLSFRDVEELLAERGIDVSNETLRRWFLKFGGSIAANLRKTPPRPSDHWHLDKMVSPSASINSIPVIRFSSSNVLLMVWPAASTVSTMMSLES